MQLIMRITATALMLATSGLAAHLSSSAERAFEIYVADLETRLATQHARPDTYLALFRLPAAERTNAELQLRAGVVQVEPVHSGCWEVSGGLLHHWRGAAFVSGATPKSMLALLRDFNHLSHYYAPEVESSHVLAEKGSTATLAIRLREQKVVTVVLDAEYEVQTELSGNSAGYSFSRSTHIWQVEERGTVHEHRRAEGDDDGFLWHLNSYWSFVQRRDGLFIECEAVSLTRDIPIGLHWLITPIVEELPKESLEFTLKATKKALEARG